jgi:transcriptional regulator with XRE-family HTH domain
VPNVADVDAIRVNGPAIREMRRKSRIEIQDLADEIGVSRAYLCKVELGHSERVSVKVLDALEKALHVDDRRALLADPYTKPVAS